MGKNKKNILKSVISILLIAALSLETTGCQTTQESAKKTITLALRSGVYSEVIKECLPAFEEEHNVKCEVLELEEDELHSGIADDGEAKKEGGSYDLVMVDGSWMAEFTRNHILANLTEMGYEFDDDIIPATTDVCYYDTEIYLAPYYGNVTVLLYNKELAKQAGYERGSDIRSLADIRKICTVAKNNGKQGFVYRGDTENNTVVDFLSILLSYGGWVVNKNNVPTVEDENFRQAFGFYLDLIKTGTALPKEDLIDAIDSGEAAMGIGWPGWYTPTEDSAANYTGLTGKVDGLSRAYNANVYGVWTVGIPANSDNKELALELLRYLMDPEVQKKTVKSGGVPCRYSSLKDPEVLKEYPQYEIVCDALEHGVYRPVITQWTDFYTVLGQEMQMVMNGTKSMDDALEDAQVRLEIIMGLQEYV